MEGWIPTIESQRKRADVLAEHRSRYERISATATTDDDEGETVERKRKHRLPKQVVHRRSDNDDDAGTPPPVIAIVGTHSVVDSFDRPTEN